MSILPGSALGMLGGGQLGRMFVSAARSMGYEVVVLDADEFSPAGSMASVHLKADYTDQQALDYLADHCAVITTEFENIPAASLEFLAQHKPVHPSAQALSIAQNRITEKTFIQSLGLATSPFVALQSEQDLPRAGAFNYPAILKTATLGYDGKGQKVCHDAAEVAPAFREMNTSCVLEQFVDLDKEVSVILARNEAGEVSCFPVAQNSHVNGILDVTVAPAVIPTALQQQALQSAQKIAEGLDYVGVMAVEFFITRDDELLVNEMAPRPHNSGHFTMDACYSSQFEQQVRMICGLPPGNCDLHTPVAMLNILGDMWPQSGTPAWDEILKIDRAFLHLYGKKQARIGRKMGHINFLANDISQAQQAIDDARQKLNV